VHGGNQISGFIKGGGAIVKILYKEQALKRECNTSQG